MMTSVLKIIFIVTTANYPVFGLHASKRVPENNLRDYIFNNYNPKVFPALENNQKLNISLFVFLSSLESVDIRSSTAKILVFFFLKWYNHQLAWNGTQFESITSIKDLTSNVWIPKIGQERATSSFMLKNEREVKIFKNGYCELPVVETLTGKCLSDIKKFPNDVHNCTFIFYTSNVDNARGYIDYKIYKDKDEIINGAWSVQTSGNAREYRGDRLGFYLNLVIRRKPDYIKRKIVIPLVILVVFTVTSHTLPIESGERIGFSMTSILTMMITLQYAMDQLPETDEEPDVIYHGRLIMFCMIISLLLTTAVINLYHKKRRPMPRKMKATLIIICRMFFVKYEKHDRVSDFKPKGGTEEDENKDWITLANVLDRFSLMGFFMVAFGFLVRSYI